MPDSAIFTIIAQLLRRQFRFYFTLLAFAIVGTIAAHGWSWSSAIVILLAVIVIPFGWVLTSFWISVFQNAGRPGSMR
jgi:NhaP-type Na+/H+ or K+/H+ antiporter